MQKLIIFYGLISGIIVIVSFIIGMFLANNEAGTRFAELSGYLIMILALSLIFIATKRYRDEHLGGVIKFGTAFRLGLGITLVASLIYVIGWEINLALTDYSFIEDYTEQLIEEKRAEGVSEAELTSEIEKMEAMKEQYSNILYRLPITFLEIFPVGLLISLLSSLLLKNRKFLAAV